MNRNLEDLMGDIPETEVRKSVVEATVTKKLDEQRFVIRDHTKQVELEVEEKFKNKIQVGYKFAFYSPEKIDSEKLRLNKGSYPKKLFEDGSFKIEFNSIRLKDILGRRDKETVEEVLVVKVVNVYEANEGQKKSMRKVRVSDGQFSVNLTFFGHSTRLCEELSPGDVISLQYVNINLFNIADPRTQPPNLTFKDLREPFTKMKTLVGDMIPEDMNFETGAAVVGTVIDITDYREYQSCKGRNNRCRLKIIPGAEYCKCGEANRPEEAYSDFIVTLVLWCEDSSKMVKCFRRSLEMVEDGEKEGFERICHLEDKEVRILVSNTNGEELIADKVTFSKASSTFE